MGAHPTTEEAGARDDTNNTTTTQHTQKPDEYKIEAKGVTRTVEEVYESAGGNYWVVTDSDTGARYPFTGFSYMSNMPRGAEWGRIYADICNRPDVLSVPRRDWAAAGPDAIDIYKVDTSPDDTTEAPSATESEPVETREELHPFRDYREAVKAAAEAVRQQEQQRDKGRAELLDDAAERSQWVIYHDKAINTLRHGGHNPRDFQKYTGEAPSWGETLTAMAYTVHRQDIQEELNKQ